MTTGNLPLRKSATELRDALSLLEKAARYRRLAAFQADGDIKVTLLALAAEYELRADPSGCVNSCISREPKARED
jgi:hypothetical protein